MPNFAAAFQNEIRRLARKEARSLTAVTRRAAVSHRRVIAVLKRQMKVLTGNVAVLEALGRKSAAITPASEAQVEKARFSPGWIKQRRTRLKLSAESYGKLVSVSGLTIYHWERGKARPRKEALARLVAVKEIGRREALRRLEMMGGAKKPAAAKPGKKKAAKGRRKSRQ